MVKKPWKVEEYIMLPTGKMEPLAAGQLLQWKGIIQTEFTDSKRFNPLP